MKRGRLEDDPEYQRSRPDLFPVEGRIVFGEVWACWKCHGVGFKDPKKRKKPCAMCGGKGWEKRPDGLVADGGTEL